MSTVASASDGSSSPSAAKILEATRAREACLSPLLVTYISSGLVFMLLPGTFLGVWNLLQISGRESVVSVSPAWLQAHGHAQVFGWIGSFIFGIGFYSIPKLRGTAKPAFGAAWVCWAMWTIGVAMRWAANIYGWQWRLLLPVSGILELAAFLIFFKTVSEHRSQRSGKDRLEPWVWVVISASSGLMLVLIGNMAACFYLALRGASPALPHILDQRYLVLVAWGFLVPFIWGFSTKWMPVFLGLRPVRPKLLLGALTVNLAGIVLTLLGWGNEATVLFVVGVSLAIAALGMFESARQEVKTRGVHRSFPFFVRMAYLWLLVAALLAVGAALWDSSGGIWGASRHALKVGFIAVMVMCVGQRILPAFVGMRIVEYAADVRWTRPRYGRMYASSFQRDSRISGICQLGVVCIACVRVARIGGDHGICDKYFRNIHSRAESRAETTVGCGDNLCAFKGLFGREEKVMNDSPKQPASSAALRSPGPLESPILSFDLNAEIQRLRDENAWQGGRNSKTLVKHPDLRVVLTVLKSGARLHEHKAAGSISVQATAGHIRMHVEGKVFDLPAGHLLALERAIAHDVEALEDSAFLLTIAWPDETEKV